MENPIPQSLRPCALTVALLAALATPVWAADGPELRFSGFGTLAVVQVDQPGVESIQAGQNSGAGESASFKSDSRLGAQVDASFTPQVSATLQLLAKHAGEGDDRPRVEWAFGKVKLGGGFTLRAGRIGTPFFAVSDFREVGYANHWLRAPTDVYGQVFMRNFDGADLLYGGDVAGFPVTVQLTTGSTTAAYERTDIAFKSQIGFNLTAELADGVTLRLGRVGGKVTVYSDNMSFLVSTLATTPYASVGAQIDCTDRKASFGGAGLNVERGNWVAATEYTVRKSSCHLPDTTGWHLMAGYRIGNFLPYATVSRVRVDDSNVVNNIPRGVSPAVDFLNSTVAGLLAGQHINQSTTAVGVRWDAWRNVAIKAQMERVDTAGGYGFFRAVGPRPTDPVQVLSLAVDLIF